MQQPSENPSTFAESITLNTPMPAQEAVEKLAAFHKAPSENILKAFVNLRGFQGTVAFKESRQNGVPIITMEGCHPDGSYAWRDKIDSHTGQPMQYIG